MRSHAKAATAGSTQRLRRSKPALLLCVLAATVAVFSLVVGSASGVVGEPVIKASWAADVVFNEATLKTEINPEGSATTYHIEYGETEAYGSETPELSVGSDSTFHLLSRFIDKLQPGTTYHYRVVATNPVEVNEGPDQTFTTFERPIQDTNCPNQEFRVGSSAPLPDCRAYEMVSPIDKNGGGISTTCEIGCRRTALNQASITGEQMTYSAYKAFGDALSSPFSSQYLATRSPEGWSTHGINQPLAGSATPEYRNLDKSYYAFTEDLSIGWLVGETGSLGEDTELLRRNNLTDSFESVPGSLTAAAGPPIIYEALRVTGHALDGSHVAVSTSKALTPDAPVGEKLIKVYDISSDGEAHLVSVLPDGTASMAASVVGHQPGEWNWRFGSSTNAMSADGSRIYWSAQGGAFEFTPLYVRLNPDQEQSALNGTECTEPAKACTIAVHSAAKFRQASVDGSAALYTAGPLDESANLYRFDLESTTSSLIAPEVIKGALGASDDLSYVYFLSKADLDEGATAGQRNLYVDHEGSITYIATLAARDTYDNVGAGYGVTEHQPIDRPTRVTPDGHRLAFQSVANLTGYDNTATSDGKPALEVYTYDAEAEELICVSCNPSGARPLTQPWRLSFQSNEFPIKDLPAAAWLTTAENQLYTPRALSEDGNRLFFNAFDALVPWDTNGQQDVYQWRAEGTGGCTKPDGCVDLISDGVSPHKAEFVDASPDGSDVFFEAKGSLLPQDPSEIDIYDARIGGGFPQPPALPECVGDACQSVPSAPNDPTPASASFRGAGDPKAAADCTSSAREAARLRRAAKNLKAKADSAEPAEQAKQLRKRSTRLQKKASVLSKSASRCRRENRRVGK